MEKEKSKRIKYRRIEEKKYKQLIRRDAQIMRAKAFLREAWRVLGKLKKIE